MSLFKKDKTKKEAPAPTATTSVPSLKPVKPLASTGRILLERPWRSEKAYSLQSQNSYVFLVDIQATKPQIRKEVAREYGVKVKDVNVILQKGKTKRLGRSWGRRSDFKKAIVTLAEGNKIEIT